MSLPLTAQKEQFNLSMGGKIPPWKVGDLPKAPRFGWRQAAALIGPGVVMVGVSVGAGEWLFGPAVSALYGGTLLWLCAISILMQMFYNLEVMRYTLYCGEPIHVGFCRTLPGPRFWIPFYAVLEFTNIWPFMASNAAVPIATAMLGHLPGGDMTSLLGISMSEEGLVKFLGYMVFLLAFLPLIFGRTIYRLLERIMVYKMGLVLTFLTVSVVFLVSGSNVWEVTSGFFRFGTAPLRAETVIADGHFTLTTVEDSTRYTIQGTLDRGRSLVTSFVVNQDGDSRTFDIGEKVPFDLEGRRMSMLDRARTLSEGKGFYVEVMEEGATLSAQGDIGSDRSWQARSFKIIQDDGVRSYEELKDVPQPFAGRLGELVENQGLERVSLFKYTREHGHLPDLDWAILAGLIAIAGAGGMANSLFSNYARDKGWGMGSLVGAIPSAVGGREITLSHVGQFFSINHESLNRWKGWIQHIRRDQAIWLVGSLLGMALPCMMSIEFVRNAPIAGNRVGAMLADGMVSRYPDYGYILWPLALFVSFLVLGPNQIHSNDNLARRWTDIIWTISTTARRLDGNQVKFIYYGILTAYGIWGVFALAFFNPLQLAKIGTVLHNVALGSTSLHILYVNHSLLPPELRPSWVMKAGVLCCGLFFLGITVVVAVVI